MLEIVREIITLLNSIGVGVIAHYITKHIDKRLDGHSAGKTKKP